MAASQCSFQIGGVVGRKPVFAGECHNGLVVLHVVLVKLEISKTKQELRAIGGLDASAEFVGNQNVPDFVQEEVRHDSAFLGQVPKYLFCYWRAFVG